MVPVLFWALEGACNEKSQAAESLLDPRTSSQPPPNPGASPLHSAQGSWEGQLLLWAFHTAPLEATAYQVIMGQCGDLGLWEPEFYFGSLSPQVTGLQGDASPKLS